MLRPKPLKILAVGAVLNAILIALLYFFDHKGFVSLIVLMIMELAPAAAAFWQKRMDYLAIILGGEFIGYSLYPLVMFVAGKQTALPPPHLEAVHALLICTLILLVLFYGIRICLYRNPFRREKFAEIPVTERFVLFLIGLLCVSFWIAGDIPNSSQQFFLNTQFVLTVLIFCIRLPKNNWWLSVARFLVVLGTFYSFLFYTNLGFAINLLVIWIAQWVLSREWKLFPRIVLLLLYMVMLQSVKYTYRMAIDGISDPSLWQRLTVFAKAVKSQYASNEMFRASRLALNGDTAVTVPLKVNPIFGALERAHDESLEKVIEWTPYRVPYWEGKSYLNFFFLIIPDWLWPGKPWWNLGNTFGRVYGYLQPTDKGTGVVFSYFAEGYMNFGWWAIFVVAVFVAVFFVFAEKLSEFDLEGFYSFTFIIFLMPLLTYQLDLGSMLVAWVYTAIVVLPFHGPVREMIKNRAKRFLSKKTSP